jgi:hypothetical protein
VIDVSDLIYDLIFDPGHGGADPGAVGLTTKEKNNVLILAKKTAAILEQTGRFRVKLTRGTDKDFCNGSYSEDLDLRNRVCVANSLGGKVFVAFHNNSAASKAYGNEVYAAAPGAEGEKLAKAICTRMATLGMVDRGVKFAGWYVCKWTDMPAVLMEYGFINAEEATILAMMDQAALAIAKGIGDHFGVSVTAQKKEVGIVDNAILMFTDEDYWSAKDVSAKNGGIAMFVRQGATRAIPADALKAKHLFVIGGASTGHVSETLLSGNDKYDTAAAVGKYLG